MLYFILHNNFEANKAVKEKLKFTLGVYYRTKRSIYHKELYGGHNPIINRLPLDMYYDKTRKILGHK